MFTTTQIKEIARKLQAMGLKDSQFSKASLPLTGEELVALVQNGRNRSLAFKDFIEETLLFSLASLLDKLDEIQQALDQTMHSLSSQEIAEIKKCQTLVTQSRQEILQGIEGLGSEILADSQTKYETVEGILNYLSTQIINIQETLDKYCVLTVTSSESGAKVYLNGQQTGSLSVKRGTLVSVVITDDSGEQLNNIVIPVTETSTLRLLPMASGGGTVTIHTLTVTATPEDATIEIDGEVRSTVSVLSGTSVHVKVSKIGYGTQEEDVVVDSDLQKSYTLSEKEEKSWSNLVITQSASSENPLDSIPAAGGGFQLDTQVTVLWTDGTTSTRTNDFTMEQKLDTSPDMESHITPEGTSYRDFNMDSNTTASQRQFTLTLYAKGPDEQEVSGTVQVTQLVHELEVSTDSIDFPVNEDTQSVQIVSDTSWIISGE